MEIKDALKRKEQTDEAIKDLINNFEQETGLIIDFVSIIRDYTIGGTDKLLKVQTTVFLKKEN